MQKLIAGITAALFMLLSVATVTCAHADTLQADNGKLLPPSGLSFEAKSIFDHGIVPNLEANVSYGAFPSFTVSGQFYQDGLNHDGTSQTIVKVAFSPMRQTFGYTAYLGYDLNHGQIPMYGLTLWSDLNYLYSYVNLESRAGVAGEPSALWLTPGVSLRLGSRLSVGGEVEAKPDNFSLQRLRLGAAYALNRYLKVKATMETGLFGASETAFRVGIAAGI